MSYTIITTEPNEPVAPLHSHMPLILDPGAYDLWLDPRLPIREGILGPCPADWLGSVPVSTRVKNDDLECIEPLAVE